MPPSLTNTILAARSKLWRRLGFALGPSRLRSGSKRRVLVARGGQGLPVPWAWVEDVCSCPPHNMLTSGSIHECVPISPLAVSGVLKLHSQLCFCRVLCHLIPTWFSFHISESSEAFVLRAVDPLCNHDYALRAIMAPQNSACIFCTTYLATPSFPQPSNLNDSMLPSPLSMHDIRLTQVEAEVERV